MILYPTETIYALGVNALDVDELAKLYELKGRDSAKVASWLVRGVADIERFAEVSAVAHEFIHELLPGALTLVLPVLDGVPEGVVAADRTIGFRISPDQVAQQVIADYMAKYDAPLTCTSANVSGQPTQSTVPDILAQFGDRANMVDEVVDDGERTGIHSTVVRVVGDEVNILREGAISIETIEKALR